MTDIPEYSILILIFICGALAGFGIYALVAPAHGNPGNQVILTANAPKPVGPYSQAVESGGFVFTSGQVGLDPVTGNLSPTIEGQTVRTMENLQAVLQAEGLGFSDVIQTRIYLTDMGDWNTVNEIYGRYFAGEPPARSIVEVKGLPKGAKIEIEMVARKT